MSIYNNKFQITWFYFYLKDDSRVKVYYIATTVPNCVDILRRDLTLGTASTKSFRIVDDDKEYNVDSYYGLFRTVKEARAVIKARRLSRQKSRKGV